MAKWKILALIIVIVVVAGCTGQTPESGSQPSSRESGTFGTSPCEKLAPEDLGNKAWCNAIKNVDESFCESISSGGPIDLCYTDVAALKKDVSLCNQLHYCLVFIGANANDPSFCAKVDAQTPAGSGYRENSYQDNCYIEVALLRKDSSICSYLTDYLKQHCLDEISYKTATNLDMCKNLIYEDRTYCYTSVAVATKDISVCDSADSELISKSSCHDVMAAEFGDLSFCNYAQNSPYSDSSYFLNNCKTLVAMKNNDPSICETISDPLIKGRCHFRVYRFSKNLHRDINL